ncbi:MAG: hypothetical protein LQ350_003457 [Teloschistes chrysophthalmus]|nr:MAG: hypothetical protein LQ350_003457 [Niorma chrysophthalma]
MVQRYIPNNPSELRKTENPQEQLIKSLEKIVKEYPPQDSYSRHELHGLYSGPTSIAYLFLQLSRSYSHLVIAGHHCKSWCNIYLATTREAAYGVTADKCGVICEELAHRAVRAAVTGEQGEIKVMDQYASMVAQERDGSDEWLYGRAGFLYLLRLVRHWVPSQKDTVDACIRRIGDCILQNGPSWTWHGKEYLGAVHGSVGIVTQLILSDPMYAAQPKVSAVLEKLLHCQDQENGNFLSSIDSGRDHLVQFCHGAPGFALSLPLIRPHCDDALQQAIDEAVAKARRCIWEKGLLTKEPNLCHGATSNALALAAPQREHFMAYTTTEMIAKGKKEGWYLEGSDPYGLYCGEAGRAWGWARLDSDKTNGVIGYSDV